MANKYFIIAKRFVRDVLLKEKWFKKIYERGHYDIILHAGSSSNELSDNLSDIDLNLVVPLKYQKKYKLQPIYKYVYNGNKIEICLITTEKLLRDQKNKNDFYWWWKLKPILVRNNHIKEAFRKASSISRSEIREKMWTNFVRFEINSSDMKKLLARNEEISFKIFVYENIKLLSETLLMNKNIFIHHKWFGKYIKNMYPLLHTEFLNITKINDMERLLEKNQHLRSYFVKVLKKEGFSDKEIGNWRVCNLTRITFQK